MGLDVIFVVKILLLIHVVVVTKDLRRNRVVVFTPLLVCEYTVN